jgi:hypothetical protein
MYMDRVEAEVRGIVRRSPGATVAVAEIVDALPPSMRTARAEARVRRALNRMEARGLLAGFHLYPTVPPGAVVPPPDEVWDVYEKVRRHG